MDEQQEEIEKTRSDLANAKRDLAEKQELTQDIGSLRTEKASLQKDIDNKRAESGSLCDKVEELQKRGFTQTIATRLSESVDLNGPKVWNVLESVDARNRLLDEIDTKQVAKEQLESEVSSLETKKQKTKNSHYSAEKKLATVEAKANVLGDVVGLVESGLKAGYKIEDLRALLSYLIEKNVEKRPSQSLAHLLQRVEAVKSWEDLREETFLAENRLTEIQRLEEETKGRVDLVEKVSVKAIEQEKAVGLKAINDYSYSIKTWLHDLAQAFQAEFEKAKANGAAAARLEQQAVQWKALIASAQALMGILESTEQLKAVQPATMIGLLERIRDWVHLRWADTLVGLSYDPLTQELHAGLNPLYYVKIWALIGVAVQAIIQQLKKEEAETTKSMR